MSGLVPMHEHRRVVEERDALKERVKYLESEIGVSDVEWFLVARGIGLQPARARFCVLLAKAAPKIVRRSAAMCALGSDAEPKILDVYASQVRQAFWAAGFVGPVINTARGEGHMMTREAAAFLRQAAPEAFPQPGGPTR